MSDLSRVLWIPDVHIPYHDERALNLALKAGKVMQPDVAVILGDFADFYAVSSHDKDPQRAGDLQYEVGIVREKLREIKKLGAKRNIYVSGNHEDRLSRYLATRAPALFNTVNIKTVLGLDEIGFEFVPYKRSIRLGKVRVTHDTGSSGPNAHRKAMNDFQGSCVIGHTHSFGITVLGAVDGPPQIGCNFGWLGDFDKIDYMHQAKCRRDWVHGFGESFMESNGVHHMRGIPIVNYQCVVNGELIK